MGISLIFLVLAFLCFIVAAVNPPWPRPNFIALGLAFWVLTLLIR